MNTIANDLECSEAVEAFHKIVERLERTGKIRSTDVSGNGASNRKLAGQFVAAFIIAKGKTGK